MAALCLNVHDRDALPLIMNGGSRDRIGHDGSGVLDADTAALSQGAERRSVTMRAVLLMIAQLYRVEFFAFTYSVARLAARSVAPHKRRYLMTRSDRTAFIGS